MAMMLLLRMAIQIDAARNDEALPTAAVIRV
jgi:hypothetical protein